MKKIVIAEDEPFMREELARILERQGYEAYTLQTFDHTADEILRQKPDLVLLDVNLPGRSGFEICGELKKRGKLVLAILHDMDFVAECFERVIVMAHGAILADGDAGTVFAMDDVLQKARLQKPSVARLCRRLSGETGELRVCLTVEEFLQRNGGTDLLEKP